MPYLVCYRHSYDGMVLATVDPFAGVHAPLLNLPVPLLEREPVGYHLHCRRTASAGRRGSR